MDFKTTIDFALALDENDPLKHLRSEFLIPQHKGKDVIYLCGNSLGLQPVHTKQYIDQQLSKWQSHAVEGWFDGDDPWLGYHKQLSQSLANILGAKTEEITVMNSLTVNLHLLMVSFYQPNVKRYKILMEGGAFPSDQYAVESQVNFHGYDPKDAIIEVYPRKDEVFLRTEDILEQMKKNEDQLALVLFSGINYYSGQFFDIQAITKAAHDAGAYAGFDLAHAAGNVPLNLHDWSCDFACWCSYKYINSGPGGISGVFVHEKHFDNRELKRFAGWWGYRTDKRFLMAAGFDPAKGAEGWQVSTSPIILMAMHKAALDLFDKAGGIGPLHQKSELLTAYLEFLLQQINQNSGKELFMVITPKNTAERGCQLSIVCKRDGKAIFNYLARNGIIGDWREPDVIRLAPVPLYNTFKDVFDAYACLSKFAGLNNI